MRRRSMMRWTYKFSLRLRSLFRKDRVEQELADEIRFHLEALTHEKAERGMKTEEARYAALRELGGAEQIKEECRDMRRINYIEILFQDLRYGLRMLAKNPGFAAVAVLTLALGIGANTAIFSVVDAAMLRKLPVRNPQDLIQLATVGPYGVGSFSYPGFRRFRDENRVCSEMAAVGGLNNLDTSINGQPESVEGRIVSGNFF